MNQEEESCMRYKTISFGFLLAFLLIFVAPLSAIDIFTAGSGMILPESISMAPADFGNYAGYYIVPDHQAGKVWAIDPATGEASILTEGLENPLNGTFLPNDGYGDSSGRFVVSAWDASTNAALWTVDSSGSKSLFTKVPDSVELYMLATPQIAPSTFASYGGSLFATGGYFDENWAGTSGVFWIRHIRKFRGFR